MLGEVKVGNTGVSGGHWCSEEISGAQKFI